MKTIKNKIKKYFKNPEDPVINELSNQDLEYINEYMNRKKSPKKIYRVEFDSDRVDIFQEDDEGVTYFRGQ